MYALWTSDGSFGDQPFRKTLTLSCCRPIASSRRFCTFTFETKRRYRPCHIPQGLLCAGSIPHPCQVFEADLFGAVVKFGCALAQPDKRLFAYLIVP